MEVWRKVRERFRILQEWEQNGYADYITLPDNILLIGNYCLETVRHDKRKCSHVARIFPCSMKKKTNGNTFCGEF